MGILMSAMRNPLVAPIIGLTVSIFVGHIVVSWSIKSIRSYVTKKAEERGESIHDIFTKELDVKGFLVGIVERLLFTMLVAYNISGVVAGMFTYIMIKMAIDWIPQLQKSFQQDEEDSLRIGARSLVFVSLLGSLISMLFAVLGGLIWYWGIKCPPG